LKTDYSDYKIITEILLKFCHLYEIIMWTGSFLIMYTYIPLCIKREEDTLTFYIYIVYELGALSSPLNDKKMLGLQSFLASEPI
jgi:hypothetical protein